jgi:CheY-like chemotaxis protein
LRRERKTIVSRNPVISVVDDDASVRVATDNLLSALGYIVHTFASAEEFLRSAHFHDTSWVIADVQMPTMSGVEMQALLLARGHRVPFIFITAYPGETVRARVRKSGAISVTACCWRLTDSNGSSAPIGTPDQRCPQSTSISEAARPCGHYLKRMLRAQTAATTIQLICCGASMRASRLIA